MSSTRAFALRATLRAACNRPIQSQARIALGRRGYASVQTIHKAGSDLPWAITSAAISIPTLIYLLYNGPVKKSHDEHASEAGERGVKHAKAEEEIGEAHEPAPTSDTDTGDAETKGHVIGNEPEGVEGGHEDKEEGAQPQDNEAADQGKEEKQSDDKKESDDKKQSDKKADDEKADNKTESDEKATDKKQSDEKAADQKGSDDNSDKGKTDSSGKDSKKSSGEMDDSTESQEKKLSEKTSSRKVDPTEK